jgi:LDH2 family malate/lactate/ureidoglycolate dehydrogenase
VPHEKLEDFSRRIFQAAGARESVARTVTHSLVDANLAGHDSHGVIRIPEYVEAIATGRIKVDAQPRIRQETATVLQIDGELGFGMVVADWSLEQVLQRAAQHSLAAAGIANCGHVGRLGSYVERAARAGFVAIMMVNGGGKEPRVAPFGGRRPVFGTNPIAAGYPVHDAAPVVIDFSTAAVAAGKIRVLRDKGERLPEGWILNRDGEPSTDPADYYNGGMLLPTAAHKGYGLGLLVEILAGLMSGQGCPATDQKDFATCNGVFFLAMNIHAFQPLAEFSTKAAALSAVLKSTPPIDARQPVLLPGEPEHLNRERRKRSGIEIPEATWSSILKTAQKLGVAAIV